MWRLAEHLVGQCIFVEQEISFISVIAAKIQTIYVNGKKVGLQPPTSLMYSKGIFVGISRIRYIHYQSDLQVTLGEGDDLHSSLP